MTLHFDAKPDQDTQIMLESLRNTVTKTLERKRRLGQYAIIWQNNAPVAVGDDAPSENDIANISNLTQ